jgi:hypothetical protein
MDENEIRFVVRTGVELKLFRDFFTCRWGNKFSTGLDEISNAGILLPTSEKILFRVFLESRIVLIVCQFRARLF